MRNFILIVALGYATSALAQQQPDKPPAAPEPQKAEQSREAQERIRAEHSAGGLGKITPEEKTNANVGAGPHKERHTGAARRAGEQSEPDAQSARGATR